MSIQVADPVQEFATAFIHHAMLDANLGDKSATEWLVSDHAVIWLDCVNLDTGFVESWIKNGCKMENTRALQRYRSDFEEWEERKEKITMAKIKWHNYPDELPTSPNGQAMYIRCHEVQSNKVRIVNLAIHIGYLDREGKEFRFVNKDGDDIYDVAQWAIKKGKNETEKSNEAVSD